MAQKNKINPADYVGYLQKLIMCDDYLGVGYEALARACETYSGAGSILRWIGINVYWALKRYQIEEKGNYRRAWINKKRIRIPVEFVNIEEANLSTNGEAINQMIDRQYLKTLIDRTHFRDSQKQRLLRFYYGDLNNKEIAYIEGVTESAVSQTLNRTFEKLLTTARETMS